MADIDLTDVAAVRAMLQKGVSEVAQDALIQQFITRASRLIMRETRREFAPAVDDIARTFPYQDGYVDLAPFDLRAATSVVLRTHGTDVTLTAETDYDLNPASAPDGVYRWLEVHRFHHHHHHNGHHHHRRGRVTVTGDWGFSSIPEDVEHACITTVVIWLRRDVSAFAATFNLNEDRLERPEALPSAVRAMLEDNWRYPVIG